METNISFNFDSRTSYFVILDNYLHKSNIIPTHK